MSKIAFMTLLKRQDSKLSPHFGKAKWVMITDQDGGVPTFVQNTGLNGRAVVEILAANGCTDVSAKSARVRCGIYRLQIYVAGSPTETFRYRTCSKAFDAANWRGHILRPKDRKSTAVAINVMDCRPEAGRSRQVNVSPNHTWFHGE